MDLSPFLIWKLEVTFHMPLLVPNDRLPINPQLHTESKTPAALKP